MRQIPITKCKNCSHFNGHYCVLEDLQPCMFCKKTTFVEKLKKWLTKKN